MESSVAFCFVGQNPESLSRPQVLCDLLPTLLWFHLLLFSQSLLLTQAPPVLTTTSHTSSWEAVLDASPAWNTHPPYSSQLFSIPLDQTPPILKYSPYLFYFIFIKSIFKMKYSWLTVLWPPLYYPSKYHLFLVVYILREDVLNKEQDLCVFFFLIYLFLAALGLRCCTRASHCGGLSCCRAWALGTRASVVVAHGL